MRQHLVYFEAAFHAPGFLFCVVYVCQDEETRSEALAMLDESSCCGNVQSSYLLWEKNRHTAVRHFFELTNEFMLGGYRLTLADFVFFFSADCRPRKVSAVCAHAPGLCRQGLLGSSGVCMWCCYLCESKNSQTALNLDVLF